MSDTPLTGAHTRGFPAGMNQRAFYEHARQYCRDNELTYKGHAVSTWNAYVVAGRNVIPTAATQASTPTATQASASTAVDTFANTAKPVSQPSVRLVQLESQASGFSVSAIFWMLMTILLTPVKFVVKQVRMVVMFASMVVICLLVCAAAVYGMWLNKADLVKWGIQLVSDSSAHMLSYLWQAWKTTAVTEPHIPVSQPEPMVPAPEPLVPMVEPIVPVPEPLVPMVEPIVPVPEPVISMVEPTVGYVEQGSALVATVYPILPKIDRVFWLIVISLIIVTVVVKAIECALASPRPTPRLAPQTAEIETQHNSDCELCRTNEVLLMDTIPKARHLAVVAEHDALTRSCAALVRELSAVVAEHDALTKSHTTLVRELSAARSRDIALRQKNVRLTRYKRKARLNSVQYRATVEALRVQIATLVRDNKPGFGADSVHQVLENPVLAANLPPALLRKGSVSA